MLTGGMRIATRFIAESTSHGAAIGLPTDLECRLSILIVIFHQDESVFVAAIIPSRFGHLRRLLIAMM
jgi:hypothetical protein